MLVDWIIGAGVGFAIAIAGFFTGLDRERSFSATLLIVIATYYMLFAAVEEQPSRLFLEGLVALPFMTLAVLGQRRWPQLIGGGLVAHALFDVVHGSLFANEVAPSWWPGFCAAIDLVLGLWFITRYRRCSAE